MIFLSQRRAIPAMGLAFFALIASAGFAQEFDWVVQQGADELDQTVGVALDASGNVYTTGFFHGIADFDPGPGTAFLIAFDMADVFVTKTNSLGEVQWARKLGGNGNDFPQAIAVDASGNVYTTGTFEGLADFDPGAPQVQLLATGSTDLFVSKLDTSGNYVWARNMGAAGGGVISGGLALDPSGNVITSGAYWEPGDFDPGPGVATLPCPQFDICGFVSKLNSSGNYVAAHKLGGPGLAVAWNVATDASGNIYPAGEFADTADMDPGAGIFNLVSTGSRDGFVSKLDSAGNHVWSRRLGGSSFDRAEGVVVDASNNVFIGGT
ncbi:MAG: hypothetical protein GY716_01410, partial [bacterium]|nr:hypothetical protein [bacterium]